MFSYILLQCAADICDAPTHNSTVHVLYVVGLGIIKNLSSYYQPVTCDKKVLVDRIVVGLPAVK
jgi:hypothetical protein